MNDRGSENKSPLIINTMRRSLADRVIARGSPALIAVIVLSVAIGGSLWLRFVYQPDAGSHRVAVTWSGDDFAGGAGSPAATMRFELAPGVFANPNEINLTGWKAISDTEYRPRTDGAVAMYSGPIDGFSRLHWSIGEEGGELSVLIDGVKESAISREGADRGVIRYETPLGLPKASILLLFCLIGWSFPIAAWLIRGLRSVSRSTRTRRVAATVGLLLAASVGLIVVTPITPAPVIRYDVVITPDGTPPPDSLGNEVLVRLIQQDGDQIRSAQQFTAPGWVQRGDFSVSTAESEPLRLRFVGSSSDQLEFASTGYSGGVNVEVNGRTTSIATFRPDAEPASPSLSELSGPLGRRDRLANLGSRFGDIFLILALLVGLGLLGSTRYRHDRRSARRVEQLRQAPASPSTARRVLHWALLPLGAWVTGLAVFWPGFMSPDSLAQWYQLRQHALSDWHPYTMAVAVGLLQFIVDSPALPIGLIVLTTGGVIGIAATWAERRGCPPRVLRVMTVLVAICPITLFMTLTLWKDAVFGVALFVLVLVFWRVAESDGEWLRQRKLNFGIATFAIVIVWISRHNGWPVVVTSVGMLILASRGSRVPMLKVLGIGAAVALMIQIPVARWLDVEPSPVGAIVYVQHISAHLEAGTDLEPDELSLLETIRPLSEPWPYDCSSIQATWAGRDSIPIESYSALESELRTVALQLAIRNPEVDLRHTLCSSKILWQVTEIGTTTYFLEGSTRGEIVDTIGVGFTASPMEAHAARRVSSGALSRVLDLPSPLLRPALYLYLLIAAAITACVRRRSIMPLVILSPAFFQTLGLVPLVLVQDTRFQYGVVLIAIVMSPLLLTVAPRRSAAEPILCWGDDEPTIDQRNSSGSRDAGNNGAGPIEA